MSTEVSDQVVERFMQLFEGCASAHGVYKIDATRTREDGKAEGQSHTVREPVSFDLWRRHLLGQRSVGIIPIREDSTASWGTVDIDYYDNLEHGQLAARIAKLSLPLVVCRSKSGGAHLFLFLTEPVQAGVVQAKIRQIAASMGFGGSEIFPKQTQLRPDKKDVGNWLNMPYFAGERTTRYGVDDKGAVLTPEEFLAWAEGRRVTPAQLHTLQVTAEESAFTEGPPCLQHLSLTGVPSGQRNNALFAMATYARKRWPDDWGPRVEEYNSKFMSPSLSAKEVQDVIKHASAKDYTYRCKEPPIRQFCDYPTCKKRKYGVGTGNPGRIFTALQKIDLRDEPRWILDVEGHGRVEVPTAQLLAPDKLNAACMEQVNVFIPYMKRNEWDAMMAELVTNMTFVETTEEERGELSRVGQFRELLKDFTTNYLGHRGPEDLTLKKCHKDEGGFVWFRLQDFEEFLARRRFQYDRGWLALRLRDVNAFGSAKYVNKSTTVRAYKMPAFEDPPPLPETDFQKKEPF